ncbi:uncharacterized protein LOC144438682 [Glandiceps talaboti]
MKISVVAITVCFVAVLQFYTVQAQEEREVMKRLLEKIADEEKQEERATEVRVIPSEEWPWPWSKYQSWRDDGRCGSFFPQWNGEPSDCPGWCCSNWGWCGVGWSHCDCHGCVDNRVKHRDDGRCGPNFPLPNGEPAECPGWCCSNWGWCGIGPAWCECDGCVDYTGKRSDIDLITKDGNTTRTMQAANAIDKEFTTYKREMNEIAAKVQRAGNGTRELTAFEEEILEAAREIEFH